VAKACEIWTMMTDGDGLLDKACFKTGHGRRFQLIIHLAHRTACRLFASYAANALDLRHMPLPFSSRTRFGKTCCSEFYSPQIVQDDRPNYDAGDRSRHLPSVRIRRSLISVHLLADLGSGVRFRVVPVCIVVTMGR
jgi:hypothetical protein